MGAHFAGAFALNAVHGYVFHELGPLGQHGVGEARVGQVQSVRFLQKFRERINKINK